MFYLIYRQHTQKALREIASGRKPNSGDWMNAKVLDKDGSPIEFETREAAIKFNDEHKPDTSMFINALDHGILTTQVCVLKDSADKVVLRGTDDDAFLWLHDHHSFSVDYAYKYGGYKLVAV